MSKLAIIVPYINEYPQVLFTLRSIHEEMDGFDHEIIAVDNWCQENEEQGFIPDRAHDHIDKEGKQAPSLVKTLAEKTTWLKYVRFDKVLSHWQCKDYAIANTDANFFLFLDAHIVPGRESISAAWDHYQYNYDYLHGTMGMPLTYHILEENVLEYSFKPELDKWFLSYSFCARKRVNSPTKEVPCHSMCGCFLGREHYDAMDGWGPGYGPYGGGENLMNFTLPTLGYKHHMWQGNPIFHHGERRGYRANQYQIIANRAIAAYKYGGFKWLHNYLICSGLPGIYQLKVEKLVMETYKEPNRIVSIEEYISKWTSITTS